VPAAKPPAAVRLLPAEPGVYRFVTSAGRTLYIGRAGDLRRRVGSYWRDLRDRPYLSRMVAQVGRVEAAVCASEHEAAWLERNLLERDLPYWNRTPGGAEVPIYIKLDNRTGLRAVRIPDGGGRLYGPYLGGLKVRLALSALQRLIPLAYAAGRLTGSERDMARVRGVGPKDRAALLEVAAAVLERDPAAVASFRAELLRRRDSASAALGFELAGQLQAELEAIDWVVAEQRVTRTDDRETVVHGWAGGLLVRFEMRAGRLSAWTQRRCSEPTARERVAATLADWQDFARRNAELAARLHE
jgi:excinuclease ABC subunit C